MINRIELKENAKKSLQGHYGDAIVVILLSAIIGGCAGGIQGFGDGIDSYFISFIGYFISIMVSAFLSFGSLSFFVKIARGEDVDYRELFSKIHMFVPYLIITILVGIFTALWTLLFIIPGIIAAFAYSLVYYIALDNPEMDALEVIRTSRDMMRGYKFEYFILQVSFLGWIILGIFTCGVLYFWLSPYMAVTNANFYCAVKANYEKKKGIKKETKKEETDEVKKETSKKEKVEVIPALEEKTTVKKETSKSSPKKTTEKKSTTTKSTSSAKKTTTKNSSKSSTTKSSSKSSTTKTAPKSTKTTSTKKSPSTPKKTTTKKSSNTKNSK